MFWITSKCTENLCCHGARFQQRMEQESRKQWPFMWAVYNYLTSAIIFWGKNWEIISCACDPQKIVNCRINFREIVKNMRTFRNYFGEKSKRLYFDNQTLLTLDYFLIPSAEPIFTFHSWNKPLTLHKLSSSMNNSEKNFLALLIAELILAIRREHNFVRLIFANSTEISKKIILQEIVLRLLVRIR